MLRLFKGFLETLNDARPLVGSLSPVRLSGPLSLHDADQLGKAISSTSDFYMSGRTAILNRRGQIRISPPNRIAARNRALAAGSAAAVLGASALGIDPLGATSLASEALRLGVHATIGSSLIRGGGVMSALGLGYLGLGAINILRPGDNTGPW
ncbi:MAG: hypothetical protein D6698_06825 [Gammaproteobacteria bacterium]|nr:MAG: hypothetical protein D6698_06825 [Gammaproteobacteria bacterium]